jgi:hypothetical protein
VTIDTHQTSQTILTNVHIVSDNLIRGAEVQEAVTLDLGGPPRSTIMKTVQLSLDTTERQERYIKAQEARGGGVGVVFADAFIRGMRDIGYKNPAWALAELCDNAIQAGAPVIDIRFGFLTGNPGRSKPDMIAIIDNGTGMVPKMISYAVRWGGTDRENDRRGFGRYGYGLPSSAVALARRYTVYSKQAGKGWHSVTVDLAKLAEAGQDLARTEKLLSPSKAELPDWLRTRSDRQISIESLESGTVVVLEDMDRLKQMSGWTMANAMEAKLLQHFGVIYRHWLGEKRIVVNGKQVEIVDPLFLMPDSRFFDETPVRAKQVYEHAFEMSAGDDKGYVRIRAALLPPNFQLADPGAYRSDAKPGKLNKRHDIMKTYNGLLICREGRQIECIVPEWTKFQTYDFNVKIEVDFDPALDEHFGITTAKQQIVIDDQMLEKLKQSGKECGGLKDLLSDMRREFEDMQDSLNADREKELTPDEARPSEQAMLEAERFRVRRNPPTPAKVAAARENLEEEITKVARDTGQPVDKIRPAVEALTSTRLWQVDFEYLEEGPFFIPKRMGQLQKRIVINTAHPFYSKLYDRASTSRPALEVLLCVLADGELEAEGEYESFYKSARQHWSTLLRQTLDRLVDDESIIDQRSMTVEKQNHKLI